MNSNITIKVTLESEGPSEFGAVKSTNVYTVCHASQRHAGVEVNLNELNTGKIRALKLINRALLKGATVIIDAEHYDLEPGVPSATKGTMTVRAYRWGDHYDVYERSEWKSECFANRDANKSDTRKYMIKGLNNLLMTCADTIKKWESV